MYVKKSGKTIFKMKLKRKSTQSDSIGTIGISKTTRNISSNYRKTGQVNMKDTE